MVVNSLKVMEQVLAVANRLPHPTLQSHFGMLGGAAGVVAGWILSPYLGMRPEAGAFVAAVAFVFSALVLYRVIVDRRPEHRIRVWALARNELDLAITAERAEGKSDSEYLRCLERVRVELAEDLHEKVRGKKA